MNNTATLIRSAERAQAGRPRNHPAVIRERLRRQLLQTYRAFVADGLEPTAAALLTHALGPNVHVLPEGNDGGYGSSDA